MEVGLKHFLQYLVIMWRLMAHFLYISQSMIYLFVSTPAAGVMHCTAILSIGRNPQDLLWPNATI